MTTCARVHGTRLAKELVFCSMFSGAVSNVLGGDSLGAEFSALEIEQKAIDARSSIVNAKIELRVIYEGQGFGEPRVSDFTIYCEGESVRNDEDVHAKGLGAMLESRRVYVCTPAHYLRFMDNVSEPHEQLAILCAYNRKGGENAYSERKQYFLDPRKNWHCPGESRIAFVYFFFGRFGQVGSSVAVRFDRSLRRR